MQIWLWIREQSDVLGKGYCSKDFDVRHAEGIAEDLTYGLSVVGVNA